MVFPATKETWPVRVTDDLIPAEDHNDWSVFLETLQDTLGLNFIGGFGSLKLRLDNLDLILNTEEIKAINTNGLSLHNLSGNGIFINDNGSIGIGNIDSTKALKVTGEIEVTAGLTVSGTAIFNGPVDFFGQLLGDLTLNQFGQIGQVKKTGIVGAGEVVDDFLQGVVKGCVWNCVIDDGTNFRTSIIKACWDGTSVAFNEVSSPDIGNTAPLTLAVVDTGTNIQLQATASSGTWEVKATHSMI